MSSGSYPKTQEQNVRETGKLPLSNTRLFYAGKKVSLRSENRKNIRDVYSSLIDEDRRMPEKNSDRLDPISLYTLRLLVDKVIYGKFIVL